MYTYIYMYYVIPTLYISGNNKHICVDHNMPVCMCMYEYFSVKDKIKELMS